MQKYQFIATTAFGLEAVVARELKNLGITDQMTENGRVTFAGTFEDMCRANLWLRSADRVLIKMGEFKAVTFTQLFEQTKSICWGDWLPKNAEFPVSGKSVQSTLYSVSDCQAIVKKAIVEKMKEKYKTEWFEENGARYKIEVSLLKDIATITMDTSGVALHKRGYRKLTGTAPLKETMAAALISLSYWKKDRVLIDPFCGTGTIPIEAALMARNIAPGLKRTFDCEKWDVLDKSILKGLREQAFDVIDNSIELRIHGSDIDEEAISVSRYHMKQAGVEGDIHFQRMDFRDISSRYKYGHIICNPPYGERANSNDDIDKLYSDIGRTFKKFDTWSYYIFAPEGNFEKLFKRKTDKKRKLFNGRILCNYYQFYGPKPPKVKGNWDE